MIQSVDLYRIYLTILGKAYFKLVNVQSMDRDGYNVSTGRVLHCIDGMCKSVCGSAIRHNEALLICHNTYGDYGKASQLNQFHGSFFFQSQHLISALESFPTTKALPVAVGKLS